MKEYLSAILVLFSLSLSACGPRGPSQEMLIRQAVAGTLSAIPTPTRASIPTPLPTPTLFSLAGLFCEYQFCIAHPQDMAFFDVSAQRNPGAPSTYGQGMLLAYNANLVIELLWQTAPGTSDSRFLMDLILQDGVDSMNGQPQPSSVREMTVLYAPISTTATPVLPYGAVASWNCGDRVFAWKVYTPDASSGEALFADALNRFTCKK
ncbi:MAG: hypothetical protein ACM3QS_13750 [Bacteroidota bacterium]